MNYSRVVCSCQRRGDLTGDIYRFTVRHAAPRHSLPQSFSVDEFSGNEVMRGDLANVVDGNYIGMI